MLLALSICFFAVWVSQPHQPLVMPNNTSFTLLYYFCFLSPPLVLLLISLSLSLTRTAFFVSCLMRARPIIQLHGIFCYLVELFSSQLQVMIFCE